MVVVEVALIPVSAVCVNNVLGPLYTPAFYVYNQKKKPVRFLYVALINSFLKN